MSNEYDAELEAALDIPEEQDHSEELAEAPDEGQRAAETEQNTAGSETEMDAGAVETESEGSDTGETDSGASEGSEEPDPMATLIQKIEALERANKGIYSDLQSERDRRKQLMEEIQKKAAEEEATKKAAEQAKSMPDKDEDPAGYLAAMQKQMAETIEQRFERMEQERQDQAQRQAFEQAVNTVNQDEARFRQERADYDDALNFARSERARLLRATHPEQTDEWINDQIARGDQMFALQSLQQGVSPAARAYDYAVRLGYQPGQTGESGNGGQAAPAAAAAVQPAQAQGQAKPAQGKPKMTSLSAVNGKQTAGRGQKITFDQFANADTDTTAGRELFERITQDPALAQAIERDGYVYLSA